jgi:hypothetical protein
MPKKDPRDDPSTVSQAYELMLPAWKKIETVLGGTSSMRESGQVMLPRHEKENHNRYAERLSRATLLNITDLTLRSWVGRPFTEPVQIGKDVPEELAEILEDIDLQGNDVTVFCRNWFRSGLAKAFGHAIVDFPSRDDDPERTLQDDAAEGLRPYASLIAPEALFFAESRVVNSKEILTHVRIHEPEVVRDGFSERTIERIRVFDRILPDEATDPALVGVYWSLWEKRKVKNKSEAAARQRNVPGNDWI